MFLLKPLLLAAVLAVAPIALDNAPAANTSITSSQGSVDMDPFPHCFPCPK